MADKKISALTASTTPLAGAEVLPIVQGGATVKVSVANLTAGRAVSMGANSVVDTPFTFGGLNYGLALTSSGNPNAYSSNFLGSNEQEFGGYYYGAGQWRSDSTAYSAVAMGAGTVAVYGNTGLTPGGTFARTLLGTFGSTGLAMPNGKGIDFSATPGTGTSELLADYEEGTWTPTLEGGTTAGSYSIATTSAYYTKIGRQVTVTARMAITVTSAGTGAAKFGGLPFAKSSNQFINGSVMTTNVTFGAGVISVAVQAWTSGSSSDFSLAGLKSATSPYSVAVTDIVDGASISVTFTYFV